MLAGFGDAGYVCIEEPARTTNPVRVEWHVDGELRHIRLWCFDVTHGGGGRNEDEFRIQITNGPQTMGDFNAEGEADLLMGYSREPRGGRRRTTPGGWRNGPARGNRRVSGGSPSVQVPSADIQAGHDEGMHRFTKNVNFGTASVVTMTPNALPAYLLNHEDVLKGDLSTDKALSSTPQTERTIVEYCRDRGFQFEPDLIATLPSRRALQALRDPGRRQRDRQIQASGASGRILQCYTK